MKIKKLGALLVSAALCAGMAAPAFAFEGEALCQHFLVQQFKRTVRKQRLLNFQEKLRDLQRFNILPELRIYLE